MREKESKLMTSRRLKLQLGGAPHQFVEGGGKGVRKEGVRERKNS